LFSSRGKKKGYCSYLFNMTQEKGGWGYEAKSCWREKKKAREVFDTKKEHFCFSVMKEKKN